MEVEICVLVEFEATGHLLFVSLVLNRLQGHGTMGALGRAFM
jgi:hypothetical protein